MKRRTPVNVGASVRARLLKVSKGRHEDFTLMLLPCPEDVAATIVFLCSAANRTITGDIVRASGERP